MRSLAFNFHVIFKNRSVDGSENLVSHETYAQIILYSLNIAERREVVEGYRRICFLTISYDHFEDLVQGLHQHTNYPNESGKIKRYRRVMRRIHEARNDLLGDRACSAP